MHDLKKFQELCKAIDLAECRDAAARQFRRLKGQAESVFQITKEDEITMKKTTLVAILAFIAAAVGALVAALLYIRRREKELDEYEQLLFSEDFNDEIGEDDAVVEAPAAEEAPAEEAPAAEEAADETTAE